MAVYTERLCIAVPPGGNGNVYTVGTGFVVVIRDLSLWQGLAAGSPTYVGIQPVSGPQAVLLYMASSSSGVTDHWEGRQVMNAGDFLFLAGGSSGTVLVATGYVFAA